MALTNSQYETIMKLYEARQTNSRHLLEERTAYVTKHIPGYNEVRNEIASVSVRQGKQLLLPLSTFTSTFPVHRRACNSLAGAL